MAAAAAATASHWIHHEAFRPSATMDPQPQQGQGLDLSQTFTRLNAKQRARTNDVPLAVLLRHDYNIQPSTHHNNAPLNNTNNILAHTETHVKSQPNEYMNTAASSFYAGTGNKQTTTHQHQPPYVSNGAATAARVFVKHPQTTPPPQHIEPYEAVIQAFPKQQQTIKPVKSSSATQLRASSTKRPSTAKKVRAQIEANRRIRAHVAQAKADAATQRALELQEQAAFAQYAVRNIPTTPQIKHMLKQDSVRKAKQVQIWQEPQQQQQQQRQQRSYREPPPQDEYDYPQEYTPQEAWTGRVPIQQVIYDAPIQGAVAGRPNSAGRRLASAGRPRSASFKGKGEKQDRPSSANAHSAILDPPRGQDHFLLAAALGYGKKHRHYNNLLKTLNVEQEQKLYGSGATTSLDDFVTSTSTGRSPPSSSSHGTMKQSQSVRSLHPSGEQKYIPSQQQQTMNRSQSMDEQTYTRSLMAASLGYGKAHQDFHNYVRAYPEVADA